MPRKTKLFRFLLLFITSSLAQERFEPQKTALNQITIDGVLSPEEWKDAILVDIDFEVNPEIIYPPR